MTSTDPAVGTADGAWWKETWLLDAERTKRLGWTFAVVVVGGFIVGYALYRIAPVNPVTRFDERLAEWFVDQRTDTRDSFATWGARLSGTPVKIVISTAFALVALWRWRRWHETLLVAVTLIFEATAFIVITFLVGRNRPDVERLLESPVDTSFPSGHVAAATVYGAFVVMLFWHVRSPLVRTLAGVACALVVLVVGVARMYQGMHYLTDVLGGIVLGLVSLIICVTVLGQPDRPTSLQQRRGHDHPALNRECFVDHGP